MSPHFKKILQPINIRGIEIRNRIAMAPMGNDGMVHPDGNLSSRAFDYFIERARGGVGLIFTGMFKVENEVETTPQAASPLSPTALFGLMLSLRMRSMPLVQEYLCS